jgi:hypothetical protein
MLREHAPDLISPSPYRVLRMPKWTGKDRDKIEDTVPEVKSAVTFARLAGKF